MQFACGYGYIRVMKQPDVVITSAANSAVKWLKSLAVKKYRDAEALFVIEGARDVAAALDAGWRLHTLVFTPSANELPEAQNRLAVSADLMSRITGRDNAQPVMGVFHQQWAATVGTGLWLGLENIRDPGNLGTILRTCDAVSAAGVLLIGQTCDPFSPETVKAAMGSLPRVPLARMTAGEFPAFRATYKGQVLGTHLKGAVDYRTPDYTGEDMLLIMGSETAGLSDAVAELCDLRLRIPMSGPTESLNLGIASALMLYEARRNRL